MTDRDDEIQRLLQAFIMEKSETKRLREALSLIDKMGGKPWELTNADAITMVMIARSALFDQVIAEDA